MGKINYTILNASALNASRLNMTGEAGKPGGGAGGYWPEGTPAAIRKSAVLWYDIALQGATNETMAEHPYLKDLTGNGHDMELRNFAWRGMSGIGGYNFKDLELWTKNSAVELNVVASNKVTILNGNANAKTGIRCGFLQNTSIKIEVEGSNINNPLAVYKLGDVEGDKLLQTITADNVYTIELEFVPNSPHQMVSFAGNNITIEQLPIYPNALVTDGVDDYGYVEGLPLLTKEKGFTVMAVRKWLSEGIVTALASKALNAQEWGGAFVFEGVEGGGTAPFNRAFNGANYVSYFAPSDFSFLTTHKYNDRNITNIGDVEDNDRLVFFRLVFSAIYRPGEFVFYRFILFNRDLTDEEIEWVRVNIMKSYTVAELCAMGYGVETSYGYNLTGNFTEAGVPVPSDLAARLAGEDGKLLKVTNLKADAAFWEAVRAALKEVTITAGNPLPNYWNGTDIGGDVEMTVAGGDYQTTTNMRGQGIRKLTLNLPSGFINSMNNAFVWAVTMEELVINGTVTTNDWTACFDHCTALKTFTAPNWSSGGANSAYDLPVSQMNSAFRQCPALVTVPQYGAEREAAGNTLRPVSMQNMLNASGVAVLGPVVDCRYINPGSLSQSAGAFGTKLTDARLANLNHGDWWRTFGTWRRTRWGRPGRRWTTRSACGRWTAPRRVTARRRSPSRGAAVRARRRRMCGPRRPYRTSRCASRVCSLATSCASALWAVRRAMTLSRRTACTPVHGVARVTW